MVEEKKAAQSETRLMPSTLEQRRAAIARMKLARKGRTLGMSAREAIRRGPSTENPLTSQII